jgi:OmpA-OmpF porin, OOP family
MIRIKTTLLALAAVAFGHGASAQTTNAYLSASAGPSRANVDCSGTTACDRSSAAAKLLFGYRIVPNFAVEVSYAYLGKVSATVDVDGDPVDAGIKGQSLGIGVAGLLPFGSAQEWTGIARAGIASNRTRVSVSGAGVSGSDSESHAEPYFGLGLNYAFTPSFDAGIAWDNTKLKYADTSTRVNVFSVVASFKF